MTTMNNPIVRVLLLLTWIASNVGALSMRASFPKAPTVTESIYEESLCQLVASALVYDFWRVLDAGRSGDIELTAPANFPIKDLSIFQDESLDLRDYKINNGNGLSFVEMYDFVMHNADEIAKVETIEEISKLLVSEFEYIKDADKIYLSVYRSINQDVSCVYGIIKDTKKKEVTVAFRGTESGGGVLSNRDWLSNINYGLAALETPELIQDKMSGVLKDRVLVHKGFFRYLFDNARLEEGRLRPQRYGQITSEIKSLLEGERGYSVYVTGHSLGGALANLFAFKLAGEGEGYEFLPRPVNCITFAAPMGATGGFRAAFEQLEQDKLIRCLRVNNREDLVPTLAPISIGFGRRRTMKHTGMNLRLKGWGVLVEHSSKSGASSAVRNNVIKPAFIWKGFGGVHGLKTHLDLLTKFKERPDMVKTLDEHYKDKQKMGQYFLEGEVYPRYDKDEEEDLESGDDDLVQ